jgi:glycosyltransferase involved in cell wall biosynthesis
MFSVVILTLNEEKALPDCLRSVAFSNDVVVLDSGSTDRTREISEGHGARVLTRAFDSFAGQRNHAQRQVAFRNPWVFHLDADERMTPGLAAECERAALRHDLDGCRVAPRMMFEGRWVRHCTDYPAYQARFVRAPQFEFIQVGHGQRESPAMRLENLSEGYLHDLSIYGIDAWIEKHRRYAKDEAGAILRDMGGHRASELLSGDALVRRRALKRLSFRLPFRPTMRFAYQYLLRGGFLDGPQGLRYCRLLATYEGFIADELKKRRQEPQT